MLFPRQHPDFLGMQVVASVLGGYFGSRLMQNLREERGYTYGVVAAMVKFEQAGYFAVATQMCIRDSIVADFPPAERRRAPTAEHGRQQTDVYKRQGRSWPKPAEADSPANKK